MNRVLILTAGFGEGHNAAARNLAVAFDELGGPGTAVVVDAFAVAAPRMNKVARAGYLALINHAPHIWNAIYRLADKPGAMQKCLMFLRREMSVVEKVIAEINPSQICSTYPVYAFMLAELKKARRVRTTLPLFNIVTDSISLNSLWWGAGCQGWFVPNEESADVVAAAGIPRESLHAAGFPVPPQLADNAAHLQPADLNAGGRPRILYMVNSGTKHAVETAALLFQHDAWDVTCPVGRDDKLREKFERMSQGKKSIRILGWTNEIPQMLLTHHAVVSKAGGATTQEAIAARCPMIVNQIVPGQEEGNYELLRRHGAGILAEGPDAVYDALVAAFADKGKVWSEWRAALSAIAKPDAARTIARQLYAENTTPVTVEVLK